MAEFIEREPVDVSETISVVPRYQLEKLLDGYPRYGAVSLPSDLPREGNVDELRRTFRELRPFNKLLFVGGVQSVERVANNDELFMR